jgi:mono/diheme cytochrome c family protein
MKGPRFLLLSLSAALAAALSCADPITKDIVDDQGNETAGIPVGEHHRAGQRCVACHQPNGEASESPFSLAGTVFAQPARQVGVDGAEIRFTDSDGTTHVARTNCVGNFFVKRSEWQPKYPILVEVGKGAFRRSMQSPIGRSGDCAACHTLAIPPVDPLSQVGHVYLYTTDELTSPEGSSSCPVDPRRPGSP